MSRKIDKEINEFNLILLKVALRLKCVKCFRICFFVSLNYIYIFSIFFAYLFVLTSLPCFMLFSHNSKLGKREFKRVLLTWVWNVFLFSEIKSEKICGISFNVITIFIRIIQLFVWIMHISPLLRSPITIFQNLKLSRRL